jgi:enterochelin esterase family protein
MKKRSPLLFLIFFLAACHPAAPSPPGRAVLPAGCQSPGTVQFLELERANGILYRYGLYLPPCYDAAAGTYPIVYLVPGRSSAPHTWLSPGAAPIADDLILTGELPPFLVVVTENTDSDMFAEAIIEDLIPYIESSYPVSPERRHHAVAGGSLGGIAAYRIGFSLPDHFVSVGMFGSGAISGEEPQIRAWMQAMTSMNRPRVFLNTGFADPLMLDRARAMLLLLDEGGLSHTHIFTDGDHSYAYWLTNFAAYLHWAALDWQP